MLPVVRFAQNNSIAVVIAVAVITILFTIAAVNISYDSNISTLIPKKQTGTTATAADSVVGGGSPHSGEHLILLVESDELFTLSGLGALQNAIDRISDLPEVTGAVTPFNLTTFRSENGTLRVVPLSEGARAPMEMDRLESFREAIVGEPLARNLVISEDLTALGAVFFIRRLENYAPLIRTVEGITADLRPLFSVHLAGLVTVVEAARRNLVSDVPKLFVPGLAVVLLVFLLGFGTIRSMVLPLLTVVMATVWTLGVMSLAGMKLSVVSIMVPPIVLALGGSYSVHVLNHYYGTHPPPGNDKAWIAGTVTNTNRTIVLAAGTTIIGFLSLLTASVRQVREFGVATSVGVLFCVLLSVLFLPAALTLMRNPGPGRHRRLARGPLARTLDTLSARVLAGRYPILALLLMVVAAFAVSVPRVRYQTDYTTYQRRSVSAIDDYLYSTRKFGGFVFVYVSVTAPDNKRGYFLERENLLPVAEFEGRIRRNPDVSYVASFPSYLVAAERALSGEEGIPATRAPILLLSRYFKSLASTPEAGPLVDTLFSPDFDRLTITIRVRDGDLEKPLDEAGLNALMIQLRKEMAECLDPDTAPTLWGDTLAYLSISEILSRDQVKSVVATLLLVLGITVIAFRSVSYGLLALVPTTCGIMLTVVLMAALGIPFDVVTVMFTSIAIGIGIDDSIHLILQFRRQDNGTGNNLDAGYNLNDAIRHTVRVVGRPILVTSMALVSGMLVLAFSRFLPVVYFGILISAVVVFTTVGALVILPALLSIFARAGARLRAIRVRSPRAPAQDHSIPLQPR